MTQKTLKAILTLEDDLRARLDAERRKAEEWLETERRRLTQEHRAALSAIEGDTRERIEAVKRGLEEELSGEIAAAEEEMERLSRPSEDLLRLWADWVLDRIEPGGWP